MDTSDNSRPGTDHSRSGSPQRYRDIEPRAYAFWSVLAGPMPLLVFRVVDGRSMEGELRDRAHRTLRQTDLLHKFPDRVVPATTDEVNACIKSHPADAPFLVSDAPG